MRAIKIAFFAVAVLALVFLILVSVEGRIGQSRQCYYVGDCQYDENKLGHRSYWCGGSYAAYGSGDVIDYRCEYPNKLPRGVRALFSKSNS